jgi:hypothetical protein
LAVSNNAFSCCHFLLQTILIIILKSFCSLCKFGTVPFFMKYLRFSPIMSNTIFSFLHVGDFKRFLFVLSISFQFNLL